MEVVKDRYELIELIGRGANAVVFKGLDRETGTTVAVKKMVADTDNTIDWRHEIHMLRSLNHPCIVRFIDDGMSDTSLYIVMDYADRGSLLTNIKRGIKLSANEVAVVLADILSGLAYLHHRGVIHRDIKAANVLLFSDGVARLCDFGLAIPRARRFREEDSEKPSFVGSVYWMSPETIAGESQNEASDVWSLGCLCIELVTGVPPFFDRDPINALYHIAHCTEVEIPDSDPDVRDFIAKCLVHDPSKRASARELLLLPWIQAHTRPDLIATSNAVGVDDVNELSLAGAPPCRLEDSASVETSLATVVEQNLVTESVAHQEAWLAGGGLRRVVGQLTFVPAEEAFHVVRVLAFAARRLVGTPAAQAFFTSLAEAQFWSMDLAVMGTLDSVAQLFVSSCEAHPPSQGVVYPPAHEAALRLLLMNDASAAACAAALHELVLPRPGQPSDSPACAARRAQAKELILRHGFDALRQVIEEQAISAFRDKQEPLLRWEGLEKIIQVMEAVALVDASKEPLADERQMRTIFATAGENWFIALEEAARHNCPSAVVLLTRFVETHRREDAMVGEHLLVSTFIHVVSDSKVDGALRLRVLRTLPMLQQASELAALQLCDTNTSVPLLAHTLFAVPYDDVTNVDGALSVMEQLCCRPDMATACASYSRLLTNVILKASKAFEKRHMINLVAALKLIDSLFTHAEHPEAFVTSNELTKCLALVCQCDDEVPPDVRGLAAMVFDALAAYSKFV
jgi:hypothetical protein